MLNCIVEIDREIFAAKICAYKENGRLLSTLGPNKWKNHTGCHNIQMSSQFELQYGNTLWLIISVRHKSSSMFGWVWPHNIRWSAIYDHDCRQISMILQSGVNNNYDISTKKVLQVNYIHFIIKYKVTSRDQFTGPNDGFTNTQPSSGKRIHWLQWQQRILRSNIYAFAATKYCTRHKNSSLHGCTEYENKNYTTGLVFLVYTVRDE